MFSFSLECGSEEELDQVIQQLRTKYDVTGEMNAKLLDDGRWRLVVHAEKPLRESTIEKLKAKPLDG